MDVLKRIYELQAGWMAGGLLGIVLYAGGFALYLRFENKIWRWYSRQPMLFSRYRRK